MGHSLYTNRALLVIDQEPIRRTAASELHELYGKMKRLRHLVAEFETVDRPAFTRWLRHEFQDQLTEINELQEKLTDAEAIASEVQMVRFALGCSYHDAYVNTMERRNLGEKFEAAFDDEDDAAFARRERSKKNETDSEEDQTKSERSENAKRGSADERSDESESLGLWQSIRTKAHDTFESIKHKYRELARMLHPDFRNGGDSWTDELWHRTQKAYNDGNAKELSELLVLAKVSLGEIGTDASVWDIRSATSKMKRSLREFRKEVNILKQDLAWGFTALEDRTRLRRRLAYDLEYQQDEIVTRLEAVEAQLARWSVPGTRTRARARVKPKSSWDLDLDF